MLTRNDVFLNIMKTKVLMFYQSLVDLVVIDAELVGMTE
jgi:hypothetical protein